MIFPKEDFKNELTQNIIQLKNDYDTKQYFGKKQKEKARDYVRKYCPYGSWISSENESTIIKFFNRDYEMLYEYIETNQVLIDKIKEIIPKNAVGSFYFYNDGNQPYKNKTRLKNYIKILKQINDLYV